MNTAELQAVLVGSDPAVVNSIVPCLKELGIAPSVYTRTDSALHTLTQQKVDAFFVDREIDPELSVLKRMRTSPSSSGAVAFAIVPERKSVTEASAVADFVMDKPLAPLSINLAVRAAYGIMLKERKRYFRRAVQIPVQVTDSMYRKFLGQTINISKTGIALECVAPVAVRDTVQLEFKLPDSSDKLNCKAQIIWTAEQGKTGLAFRDMKAVDRDHLAGWVEEEFHRLWQMPVIKSPAGKSIQGDKLGTA